MCGVEYPEDIKYENEKKWTLEVDGYTFTMNTDIEREKTLAFSKTFSYKQKIIKIEDNGIQEVYDIEVDKVHNFLANGIVSHNCSLYPTT